MDSDLLEIALGRLRDLEELQDDLVTELTGLIYRATPEGVRESLDLALVNIGLRVITDALIRKGPLAAHDAIGAELRLLELAFDAAGRGKRDVSGAN